MNESIEHQIRPTISDAFSGAVYVRLGDQIFHQAFGHGDNAYRLSNDVEASFGIASGTKGFTAVAIAKLIQEGAVDFETPAFSVFRGHVSNINPDVTIQHLLGHTSGVADYLDGEEIEDINQFVLGLPVNKLLSPLKYMPLLEEKHEKFSPSDRFSYSNSRSTILAIIVEILSGSPYQDIVVRTIFKKAGMKRSGFFRSGALPSNVDLGYVDQAHSMQTNIFHPPVRVGDGSAYPNAHDTHLFWQALANGDLIAPVLASKLVVPRQQTDHQGMQYGYGFWLDHSKGMVVLTGSDVGVSFHSDFRLSNVDGLPSCPIRLLASGQSNTISTHYSEVGLFR